ncbi:hypothetical protein N8478_00890, partial [bacterium]|nr:hypothetical protein [bacterium]
IYGGAGDDFMSASVYSSYAAYLTVSGGVGVDSLYITSSHSIQVTDSADSGFTRDYLTTKFTIVDNSDGSTLDISVIDDVEFISWGTAEGTAYILTEDLANGLVNWTDWDEVYDRTHGANADWSSKGLNTYDEYHSADWLTGGVVDLSSGLTGKKAYGGSGQDVLILGKGKQKMFGGDEADLFAFTKRGKKEKDILTDFDSSEGDMIGISAKALKGISSIDFATADSKAEMKTLFTEEANVVYLSTKGKLYYDQNGEDNGLGKKGGMFAKLKGNPTLVEDDFMMI